MELKMAFHHITGRRIVEVYDNADNFVATITPSEETNGIHIVSRHFDAVNPVAADLVVPAMSINITFRRFSS